MVPPTDGGNGDVAVFTGNDGAPTGGPARATPTNGSAIAVSADDRVAVAVNRTADSISVFNLSLGGAPPTASRTALLPTGTRSEPWAVVIGNDDDTAYAILRHERRVVKITGLKTTPALAADHADTGSEPTGIAISPTGALLFVTNWADGTVSVIDTATMHTDGVVDLNASLAGLGVLGPTAGSGRPALAHPRSIVVTNNGDTNDGDETAYVTEFFSQARTSGVPTDNSAFDLGRQGVVYRFSVGSGVAAAPITIAPVAQTGFVDSDGAMTGCFPNQLYAATLNHDRLYVTSVCASPRGPTGPTGAAPTLNTANFKTEVHAGVFVIDTATNAEVPAHGVLLTQRFQALYDAAMTPDDGAHRRVPLIPNDIAFVPNTSIGYVTSYGSDAVFRIRYADDGSVAEVGSSGNPFIDLAPAGGTVPAGKLPVGIAIANATANAALVINENTRNLSLITFTTQSTVAAVPAADPPQAGSADERDNDGRRFFATGLGRWSFHGQGWNSCAGCHPDGLTDNVTWFFARGPRQTISLDGTFSPDGATQRLLNWTAIFDEVQDFENNTRGNSGGVGAFVHQVPPAGTAPSNDDRIIFDGTAPTGTQVATATPQTGLTGAASSISSPTASGNPRSSIDDFDRINQYVQGIRAPRAPTNLAAADVAAGRALFVQNNCAGCHGSNLWTISRRFYTPNETNDAAAGLLRTRTFTLPTGFAAALSPLAMAGPAPLRFTPPAGSDPMTAAALIGGNDQINCVLRSVGTVPAGLGVMGMPTLGIAPMGVLVNELRTNMTSPAQGATGFNPPSLFGMATGAPYFHAGNARTLEEALDTNTFCAHASALSINFCGSTTPAQIHQLAAFLLSIDEDSMPIAPQGSLSFNPDLCPTSL